MMGAIAAATGTEWSLSDWSEVDWRADIVFDRSICDGAILTRFAMYCVEKLSICLNLIDFMLVKDRLEVVEVYPIIDRIRLHEVF